jgi:segregation and condensation protein B
MMDRQEQRRIVEGLLLAAPEPLTAQRLGELVPDANAATVRELVAELNAEYAQQGRGFEICEVAGGWQLRTCLDLAEYVRALHPRRAVRLSRAALETLAVVAYKQPVTRAEVEHVRGVDAGAVLRSLLERELVRIAGHREIPGRPMLYATTRRFLEVFGLSALEDLPSLRDLQEIASSGEAGPEPGGTREESAPEEDDGSVAASFDEEAEPEGLDGVDDPGPGLRTRFAPPVVDDVGEAEDPGPEEGEEELEQRIGKPH